ncbi:TPA: LPXTG cell wall anchor domain-containing protein [Streptococcus suis]|nr:LPXTG cell wall anchor domain-containing protein [Streptococcus suis]
MKKNYLKLSILSFAVLGLVGTQSVQADSLVYQSTLTTVPNESFALNSVGSKEFHYALFDIDKNGQEELVIGEKVENGSINPVALYYTNQQTPTLLIGKIFGPAGGDNFQVYDDGTIQIVGISRGSGEINAKLYQLSETNGEVILLQEVDYKVGDTAGAIDVSGKTEVDLSLLDYKPLATPISAGSSEQAIQAQQDSLLPKVMREAAIGQEITMPHELVGTWLTVDTPNGTKPGRPSSLEIGEDGSYAAVYSDGNVTGNMTTLRKVSENGFVITSDSTNNGLFGLNGIGWLAEPNKRTEFGILLEGQTLKNVSWTVTIGAEDYSNPNVLASFTNPNFVVKEEETVASSTSTSSSISSSEELSSSSSSKTEETSTVKKQESKKLFGFLPKTGVTYSVLGVLGIAMIGFVAFWFFKKKI